MAYLMTGTHKPIINYSNLYALWRGLRICFGLPLQTLFDLVEDAVLLDQTLVE